MLLSGVLFALFLAGCWLYCLTEAARTPAGEYTGWSKRSWIVIIAVTFIAGAIAWLTARKLARARRWPSATVDHLALASPGDANVRWYEYRPMTSGADAALGRHPAGRSRMAGRLAPKGPDDDPEFLRELARRIHGDPTA
jgi:hypothetical protein